MIIEDFLSVQSIIISNTICKEYALQIVSFEKETNKNEIYSEIVENNNLEDGLTDEERFKKSLLEYSNNTSVIKDEFSEKTNTISDIVKNLEDLGVDRILAFMYMERYDDFKRKGFESRYTKSPFIFPSDAEKLLEHTAEELINILQDYYHKFSIEYSKKVRIKKEKESIKNGKKDFFTTLIVLKKIVMEFMDLSSKEVEDMSINELVSAIDQYNMYQKYLSEKEVK